VEKLFNLSRLNIKSCIGHSPKYFEMLSNVLKVFQLQKKKQGIRKNVVSKVINAERA
jgi:hypothetical protein